MSGRYTGSGISRFAVVKALALDNLERLIEELFGAGANPRYRRTGGWNICWPYRAGSKPSQTIIDLTGARRGGWCDFVSGEKGDVIDLVAAAKEGAVTDQSRLRAVAWLEDRYGVRNMNADTRRTMEAEASARRRAMEAREAARRKALRDRARRFFFSCSPEIFGTPVETYFRVSRGLDLHDVPGLTPAFRFHPACEYWLGAPRDRMGRKSGPGPTFPALISAMVDGGGHLCACHYTFLSPDGREKAEAIPHGLNEPKAKERRKKQLK